MIKVSDYLIKILKKAGVKVFFGVQGGAIAHLIESSSKAAEYIPVLNEQSAGLSAHGYYFANNKPSAVLTTTGPGYLNAITGLAACYYDNIPCVFITGQVSGNFNLAEKFKMKMYGFQEVPHLDIGKKIADKIFSIKSLKDLINFSQYLKDRNYKISNSILVEIQDSFSRQKIKFPILKNNKIRKNILIKNQLKNFFKEFNKAKNPIILIGSGFSDIKSKKKITSFSQKFNIPLASSWGGSHFIDKQNNLFIGYFGTHSPGLANKMIAESDLLICLGLSLLQHQCGKNFKDFAKNKKILYVNNNINALKRVKADFGNKAYPVKSDTNIFLKECLNHKTIKNLKFNLKKTNYSFINNSKPVDILANIFTSFEKLKRKKNKIIFSDAGATLSWSYQAANISKSINLITSYNLHTMGYSLPAAIGASLNKKNYSLAIIGDGGFLMNCQELVNFSKTYDNLKLIIINNKGYGIIRQTQEEFFKSNYVGSAISSKNNLSVYDPVTICKGFDIKVLEKNENIKKNEINLFLNSKYQCMVININHNYRVSYTKPKNKNELFYY